MAELGKWDGGSRSDGELGTNKGNGGVDEGVVYVTGWEVQSYSSSCNFSFLSKKIVYVVKAKQLTLICQLLLKLSPLLLHECADYSTKFFPHCKTTVNSTSYTLSTKKMVKFNQMSGQCVHV